MGLGVRTTNHVAQPRPTNYPRRRRGATIRGLGVRTTAASTRLWFPPGSTLATARSRTARRNGWPARRAIMFMLHTVSESRASSSGRTWNDSGRASGSTSMSIATPPSTCVEIKGSVARAQLIKYSLEEPGPLTGNLKTARATTRGHDPQSADRGSPRAPLPPSLAGGPRLGLDGRVSTVGRVVGVEGRFGLPCNCPSS